VRLVLLFWAHIYAFWLQMMVLKDTTSLKSQMTACFRENSIHFQHMYICVSYSLIQKGQTVFGINCLFSRGQNKLSTYQGSRI